MPALECLICKAPLRYTLQEQRAECALCHKVEMTKSQCVNGHYVCNECHSAGIDSIVGYCLHSKSCNPIALLKGLMALPFCHMHGPEHHILVGASLLTAYANASGNSRLEALLQEMLSRGKQIPGGVCGFWGACGAGISTGIFVALVTDATPLSQEAWGLANQMTARALGQIAAIGGPRCCKRDSYLAIREAVAFSKEVLKVEMDCPEIQCTHSAQNRQCIGKRCPFFVFKNSLFVAG